MPSNPISEPPAHEPVTVRQVVRTWWPLAASWILMAMELPAVSAIMARLADPKISLAAYGGVVFPLAMIIEAPIIMLLAASTTLSKDWSSYLLLRRFMMRAGLILTAIHFLVAATPLFDLVVAGLIRAPEEIHAPARLGLLIMTPWTWSIAYRRLHQGVLIRFGRTRRVGIGTAVRLLSNGVVLAIGFSLGSLPGIVVGSLAVAVGVLAEAIFIRFSVQPVLHGELRAAPAVDPPLSIRRFYRFYVPLAMTPLLMLLSGPIGSAAVSRMPRALDSLAVWPVINGLTFALRSVGIAFNEVVVALLDRPRPIVPLRRFAVILGCSTSGILLLIAATPLARLYFGHVSALAPPLAELARGGVWLFLLGPGLAVVQSWYQGLILHSHRTRAITESVAIFLAVTTACLGAGIAHGRFPGIYVVMGSMVVGGLAQVAWLRRQSRQALRDFRRAEEEAHIPIGSGFQRGVGET